MIDISSPYIFFIAYSYPVKELLRLLEHIETFVISSVIAIVRRY
jgi:hypothetical protein